MSLIDNINRLKQQLLQSGLQKRDNPLWQVINQLIGIVTDTARAGSVAVQNVTTTLVDATYVTHTNQVAILPNSRKLTAGTGITLDTSVAGIITIDASASPSGVQWSVLTNGDVTNPELVFAGGDVIMTHIP